MYTLESDSLIVTASDQGAELTSIKCKITGKEYLWQPQPGFWQGQAPVLFPTVGRLLDGKYSYKGQTYEMPIHGFVSQQELCIAQSRNRITFSIWADPDTRKTYPFSFAMAVEYKLIGRRLKTTLKVLNTGVEDVYFGIGGHPGFICDGDACLEIGRAKYITGTVVSPAGFLQDETYKLPSVLPITDELFEKYRTIVLVDTRVRKVTLKSAHSTLQMRFNTPHFAVWKQPGASFVCLEPWAGLPDYEGGGDFTEKRGNICLRIGEKREFTYTLEVLN